MRLSEAILLGSTIGEEMDNLTWDTCLIGISCRALGVNNSANSEAQRRWPWLHGDVSHPDIDNGDPLPGWELVTGLCSGILSRKITFDRAAEIVRAVEPPEPDSGEIRDEQTDVRQVPIPVNSLKATEA